ncbi:MAG: hypothetical protein Q4C34_06880 [Bacteroidales bacterium]|nr:hypothetical protein [Bacteroidales bacterium]
MKKFAMLIVALVAACSVASAQYLCTTPGTVLTYRETNAKEKIDQTFKATIIDVTTAEDGTVSARVEEKHPVPGNRLSELTSYMGYSFNPADTVTTVTLMTPDDFKISLAESIREMGVQAGQSISDSQIAEILDGAKISGHLTVPLAPNAAVDTKFANSTLRCSMMGQMMSFRMTKGLYKGFETIETEAGKFDCIKITYVLSLPEGGAQYTTQWYAPGVGLIRDIDCNKKGEIQQEQVLTAITAPAE